jgi:DNA-binding MarR family transcriptional regulator
MEYYKVYGFEMARIAEVYLSTLSTIMKPEGIERYFVPLLYLCEHSGRVTQKDLAEALGRDKVSAMRMVDSLCDKGLILRKQDCNDRRCQLLEVTAKARALVPKIKQGIEQTNNLLLQHFLEPEKKEFRKSIDKLLKTMQSLPEPEFIVEAFKRNHKIVS